MLEAGVEHWPHIHSFRRGKPRFVSKCPYPDRTTFTLIYGRGTKWIKMPLKYLAVIDLPAIAHPTESISYTDPHFTTGIETLTPLD